MHGQITISSGTASMTDTADQRLNRFFVDKIFQAILVWILKLEFVVICQKAE